MTNSVLPFHQQNLCLYDRLANLFVDEWSTNINYSKYVANCAPSFCTYTTKDQINFSYTITLLISLYGSLTLILRFIATFLVDISSKIKRRLINTQLDSSTLCLQRNEVLSYMTFGPRNFWPELLVLSEIPVTFGPRPKFTSLIFVKSLISTTTSYTS